MTKVKLCGLSRIQDIDTVNEFRPEYIGFVFAKKSRRYVSPEQAAKLKERLHPEIQAVGVFVDEEPEVVADLIRNNIIDMVQLHGTEDEDYIKKLRIFTDRPIIQAFRIVTKEDIKKAEASLADYILLDSGAGTGTVFDWELIQNLKRPYFLAGGLDNSNVEEAVRKLEPFAVDVSSGIETGGIKDKEKMAEFVTAVRKEETI